MSVPVSVKRAVIERDGGFCLMALPGCLGEAQTAHHRANRGAGGSQILDDPTNLAAVCSPCNGAAEDTNTQTLHRAMHTPIQSLDGDWWLLISATERRNVTEEIERRRERTWQPD